MYQKQKPRRLLTMTHIKRVKTKRRKQCVHVLNEKENLFTCYAGNEGPKVKNDLPCWRLERVLDFEAVALNASGFEGKDPGQAFDTGFERAKQVKYPSLLDSKEGTSGMLLDSKETGMCCSSELKEVTMILFFILFSQVLKSLRILNIHSPAPFFSFFVQMNSLFIEKGFQEAWGAKIIK